MVGREAELIQLHNLFEKALRGERQVVFVTGEAGIGKTTLVDAFLEQIRDRPNVRVTFGQCVEQAGPGAPYLPLLEATTRLCRAPGGKRRVEALQRYAPSWLVQLPGLLEPQDRHLLQQRMQGTSRERMLREMAEAAELFTTTRTLVLVLEDLHWSDVSTLDWVSYMARRREPAKLLILGTYRPAEARTNSHPLHGAVQELRARGQCEELRLTPLAEKAIGEYLTVRFKADVEAQRAAPLQQLTPLLYRRTGGNPLFLVNTVDYLIRQGVLVEDEGEWTLHEEKVQEAGENIPDTLRLLIERQIERLEEPDRLLLDIASVSGMEFATAAVAAGASMALAAVEERCEQLARKGQFIRSVDVEEWPDGTISGRYGFAHALYQQVLYERIAQARRVRLHRLIGERQEHTYGDRSHELAAELAVHFEQGQVYAKAIHYHHQAGKNAVGRSAHREAMAHLQRGLELLQTLPPTPERDERELWLRLTLVESLRATKGYGAPEVERACARARELCQQGSEPHQLSLVLWGLVGFYLTRAELQTARELGEQLLRLAHSTQDPTLLPAAHLVVGQPLFHLGELALARAHLEQSPVLYDCRTDHSRSYYRMRDPGVANLCYEAWVLWLLGYAEQALKRAHAAFCLAEELSHPLELAQALNYAAGLHYFRRERQAAQEQAEAAVQLSTEWEFPFWAAMGNLMRGWALAMQGRGEDGVTQMSQGLATWRALGAVVGQPGFLAMLAEAQGEAGRVEEGLRTLAEAVALVAKTGERYYEAELYRLTGELTLQSRASLGQVSDKSQTSQDLPEVLNTQHPTPDTQVEADAEACFLQALEIARSQQAKSLELRAAMSLARVWQRQNRVDDARELLEEIYSWFTEGFDTKDLQDAAALLSELGGRVERAEGGRRAAGGNSLASSVQRLEPKRQAPASGVQHLEAEEQLSFVTGRTLDPRLSDSRLSDPNTQHLTPYTFRKDGEYWVMSFAGTTCRLKDAHGLRYIAHLLQQPYQEVHVITLLTGSADPNEGSADARPLRDLGPSFDHAEGIGDAGEILDPQARAAYKRRLSELREELAEAQRFHDLGRSEQLAAEIDLLTHELTRAVGLGGRARQMGSPTERARVNITRAIKRTLRTIGEHHPALGQHLATTIKTGTYCSYTPDPRLPITWQG